MKKIAVPTRGNQVDSHFGHCESYSIFTIGADNSIEKVEPLASPQGCGCKSDIALTLAEMGVSTMLAGNIGQGAINKIQASGIAVVRGCEGDVKQVVEAFLNNKITDSGLTCSHHEGHDHGDGHVCQH